MSSMHLNYMPQLIENWIEEGYCRFQMELLVYNLFVCFKPKSACNFFCNLFACLKPKSAR